jgi:hypothetical protein
MNLRCLLLCGFVTLLGLQASRGDDFFDVLDASLFQAGMKGHWLTPIPPKKRRNGEQPSTQCIMAHVLVNEDTSTDSAFAHVYFYDEKMQLIAKVLKPSMVYWSDDSRYAWLAILPKGKPQSLLFAIPDDVQKAQIWSAVVVFGDSKGVDVRACQARGNISDYDYPEKNLLEDKQGPPIDRTPAPDTLIEHVVQTGNPDQPQITLFLRMPKGITDMSQVKGVLCMCVLAQNIQHIRLQLQGLELNKDSNAVLKFAADNKLAIVCWGAHSLWDAKDNWDDLSVDSSLKEGKAFDQVADAWVYGIQYFVSQYKLPPNGYLLWGMSEAGQYACRLALRKPEYFLAIHAHIPSSFDKPTPDAAKVLWCLTTGEDESGYERSLHFYDECRALGYPIIYKAIIGLGHKSSPVADDLGIQLFTYALSIRDQRISHDQESAATAALQFSQQPNSTGAQPWLSSFETPLYVGDIINQEIVSYNQRNKIPVSFQVPLPTKELADAWNK